MKKRIGSILYDTEKSILVLPPDLYRKKNSFLFFRCDGESIQKISNDDAEKIIRESGNQTALGYLSYQDNTGRNMGAIKVDLAHLNRLSAYCRENKVTQKEVIEGFIETLPVSGN